MLIIKKILSIIKNDKLFLLNLLIFLVYIIIMYTPLIDIFGFIPDYSHLSAVNPKDFFTLIIGVISSIFGIIVAIIIIAVEFSKERIDEKLNSVTKNALFFSINLIVFSFIAYVQIDIFNNPRYLTIGYYLGLLFILYLLSIYPFFLKIVSKSSRIFKNSELVNELNLNSFQNVSMRRFDVNLTPDDTMRKLKGEIDLYILNNEVLSYEKINNKILKIFFGLIGNGWDRKQCNLVVEGIVWLWRENAKTAIRVKDFHFFELVWDSIRDIYIFFANRKAPLLHLQELHSFIYLDFIQLHTVLDNSLPLLYALDNIEVSFKTNLFYNCPKEENIFSLMRMYEDDKFEYELTTSEDSIQWDYIYDIIHLIINIQETAITLSDKDLFEESANKIINICEDLLDSDIGNYQRGYIIWKSLTYSSYLSYEAVRVSMYGNTSKSFNIPTFLVNRLIEENTIDIRDVRIIIKSMSDYLILTFKDKKLDTTNDIGTLHNFCMIGVKSLKYYKTNLIAKQTVDYIMKVLIHLKELAESDLSNNKSNDYLAIKKKIKHFINVAIKYYDFKETEEPVKDWNVIYKSFKDAFEDKDFGIIKWEINKTINMDFLLLGGQPNTGKSESIKRIALNLLDNYTIVEGVIPTSAEDFTVLLQGNTKYDISVNVLIHSATDDAFWINKLKEAIDKYKPDIVITSIRDIDWQRNKVIEIIGNNSFIEIPLARITRTKKRRDIALNWYRNIIDNIVNSVLANRPFDLM